MENQYLIKPKNGLREDTKLAVEYSEGEIKNFLANGYYLVNNADFNKLIGNAGKEYLIADDGTIYVKPDPSAEELLAQAQEEKLTQAKTLFAEKRDAIRFITLGDVTYGFDCASEDITNFMAAWKDAEMNGSTQYKVWTSETDKGVVTLTNDNFNTVFKAVRNSQFEAYAWLTTVQAQIEACTTAEEVEAIEI